MRSYSRSSLSIIGGNVAYGAAGLAQAMVVAAVYGAGKEYDLYLIAQTAPELWNYLLAGLLQSAFLPAFLRLTTRAGAEEGWRLRWASLGFVLIASAGLLTVVGLAGEAVVRLLAPGFEAEVIAPCARLFRFLLVAAWLTSLTRLLANLHQAERSFVWPAAVQSLTPAAVILCVLLAHQRLGVYALWLGLCLGVLAQSAALWPRVYGWGRAQAGVRLWHPEMAHILALSWPLILGVLANRINFAVDRAVASTLAWGDISALRFGLLPIITAVWVFSFPFTQAIYPRLCNLAEEARFDQMADHLASLSQFYLLLFTPAAGLVILFAREVVVLLFGRGAFGPESVALTTTVLACYGPCLLVLPLVQLVSGLYASLQRTRSLSLIAAAVILLNLAADLILARWLGLVGIALGTSLIQAAWVVLLYWRLSRFQPQTLDRTSLMMAVLCLISASLIGAGLWWGLDFDRLGLAPKIGAALLGLGLYAACLGLTFRGRLAELWADFKEGET